MIPQGFNGVVRGRGAGVGSTSRGFQEEVILVVVVVGRSRRMEEGGGWREECVTVCWYLLF